MMGFSASGHAQNAAGLFKQGRELAEKGKWAEACPLFAEASRLEPNAVGIKLNMAECYKHVGKTASAWNAYNAAEFLAKKDNDNNRAQFAHNEAAQLEPKLSKLKINAKDTPGLQIRRDDSEVAKGLWGTVIPVDPGEHKIEATAPGYSVWTTIIKIGPEKDLQTIEIPELTKAIEPEKPGSRPNPALRPAAFAVGGVGAAGLIVGGIFGGLALGSKGTLTTECPNNVCSTQKGKDARASAGTQALVSTVSLSVGGAALATGVVLFVLSTRGGAPKSDEAPRTSLVPTFGPQSGGLTLVGSF
jgi:hypothetical protein